VLVKVTHNIAVARKEGTSRFGEKRPLAMCVGERMPVAFPDLVLSLFVAARLHTSASKDLPAQKDSSMSY
jgi:hypothetical protein